MTHASKDLEDIPGSNFNLVPSVSRELALKILQQVDKMVSPKKKSPSKLSPSMLRGPALKSLQASKFLDDLSEKKENLPSSSHQKPEKIKENGVREFLPLSQKTCVAADDTSKAGFSKDHETCVNGAYSPLTSSVEEHPPKRQAFRMIADEDLLELGGDHSEPSTSFEVAEKQKALEVKKGVNISMPRGEKPLTSSEVMASTSYIPNGDVSHSTFNGSLETGRSQFSGLPIEAVQPSEPTPNFIQGTEISAKLTSEGGDISQEEHTKAAAVFPSTFSSPPASTDTMNMEDSLAEDTEQANKTSMAQQQPIFGQQQHVSMPHPSFSFGGAPAATPPPPMANPFQFGVQPIASTQHNESPSQAGGRFSLGSTGGGDKSSHIRNFKAKKTNRRRR
ncbi:unnamed protein product [Eruca vesicaria subsp. sativa]|uniref:Uncharacterized protein n=1 Tax=Eruca vesicaria subsp. sativa TaxID=29727 RepID=A0ABC8LZZ2_ERUVS|nr:unnamed protein product [Eruca vesicaria subsp. sativa]